MEGRPSKVESRWFSDKVGSTGFWGKMKFSETWTKMTAFRRNGVTYRMTKRYKFSSCLSEAPLRLRIISTARDLIHDRGLKMGMFSGDVRQVSSSCRSFIVDGDCRRPIVVFVTS